MNWRQLFADLFTSIITSFLKIEYFSKEGILTKNKIHIKAENKPKRANLTDYLIRFQSTGCLNAK